MEREAQTVKKEGADIKLSPIVEEMVEYVKYLLSESTGGNILKASHLLDHCARITMLPDPLYKHPLPPSCGECPYCNKQCAWCYVQDDIVDIKSGKRDPGCPLTRNGD